MPKSNAQTPLLLEISRLNYKIAQNDIIKDFDLSLAEGEILTLFGASGCGKSTLLRCVAGILEAESGRVECEKSAFVFQEHALFENLNALQNVAVVMKKPDNAWILARFRDFLLDEKDALKYPNELSGGMRARVAFIRALAYDARLFLLDEPFSALDSYVKQTLIKSLISRVKAHKCAALLVTHDAFEVCALSDRICFLTPKNMQIEKILRLEAPFHARDERFINATIAAHFKDRIYCE